MSELTDVELIWIIQEYQKQGLTDKEIVEKARKKLGLTVTHTTILLEVISMI